MYSLLRVSLYNSTKPMEKLSGEHSMNSYDASQVVHCTITCTLYNNLYIVYNNLYIVYNNLHIVYNNLYHPAAARVIQSVPYHIRLTPIYAHYTKQIQHFRQKKYYSLIKFFKMIHSS